MWGIECPDTDHVNRNGTLHVNFYFVAKSPISIVHLCSILDTKHLCSEHFREQIPSSVLRHVYDAVQKEPFKLPKISKSAIFSWLSMSLFALSFSLHILLHLNNLYFIQSISYLSPTNRSGIARIRIRRD